MSAKRPDPTNAARQARWRARQKVTRERDRYIRTEVNRLLFENEGDGPMIPYGVSGEEWRGFIHREWARRESPEAKAKDRERLRKHRREWIAVGGDPAEWWDTNGPAWVSYGGDPNGTDL